jgi:hypothetical protein
MFDLDDYLRRLEIIRKKNFMSKVTLANELGISFATLLRAMDPNRTVALSNKTLKSIFQYVEKVEGN